MASEPVFLGLDVGSVSVNVAVVDEQRNILHTQYLRHKGRPLHTTIAAVEEVLRSYDRERFAGLGVTGAGGHAVAECLGGRRLNEVIAQATATGHLHPEVRTVVEIGGEDSKLISLREEQDGLGIADFAMNTMCAAGTGSFLDQQASRLGLTIEEFGELALQSKAPPRVAGRCSVFAKSDMIHLQQKATPTRDIVAGLCLALVRNFKSTVGSAASFDPPVSFQGGVAANPAIVHALEKVLELQPGELVIPEHFNCMGAIGAAYSIMDDSPGPPNFEGLADLAAHAARGHRRHILEPLRLEKSRVRQGEMHAPSPGKRVPAYLGLDVGSISTNLVVLDAEQRVLAKRYLMTAGQPIEAVRTGLLEIGREVGDLVEIRGVCTTGSGRYLTGDFVGADVVKNEITAQARAAAFIDPEVDTIFEIGGQDSKYISLEDGNVVDFEMNKVCAAGTGSFLEEQAEKLGISIKGEFGELALAAEAPINLGERCTVFMESELLKHQQDGADLKDLVSGLAYSIVYNYLNRVVAGKRVGDRIFFQGGTAFNQAVVAAFEQVTGKPITVPPHHEVTGAIGCALIAQEHDTGAGSKFKGFDLTERRYEIQSFECKGCPNHCEINKVIIEGERPLFYGSRCEKYDVDRHREAAAGVPDLFAEREQFLLNSYSARDEPPEGAPRIGMPRALLFFELYPFWQAFFSELGCEIVLSDPTNKEIIHSGAEASVAETCFPTKVALGHVLNLLDKGTDYIFLPSVINLPKMDPHMTDSFVCPYIQSLPYAIRSAIELEEEKLLKPVIYLNYGTDHRTKALAEVGRKLGKTRGEVRRAVEAGQEAWDRFLQALRRRGEEVLQELGSDERAIVVVSRSYNGCDPGANLEIPRKLRNMGVLAIPMDFLPLDDNPLTGDWTNMYWRYGQKIMAAAEIVARDDRLFPLYLTNFGCGPDSFITKFFRERLGDKACLIIEVDEHSADAGMITRCEAFLDSLEATGGKINRRPRTFEPLSITNHSSRTVLIPNMSPHAFALAAAFQCSGMDAQVMEEPDEETLYWGRQYTSGKECFPCIVTTGDMVKYAKREDFDRDKYAFFMGGSGGPCRFGQYSALQRMVLDELGFEDVPLYAPNQASSFYDDLGIVGRKFLRQGWRGIVAADILYKALRETKPYETVPGSAQQAFDESLEEVCNVIRTDGDLVATMWAARRRFDRVETNYSASKPVIGLVGEFYIRANRFSNQNLVQQIEDLGGEVWMAPVFEWFLYRNVRRGMRSKLDRDYGLYAKNWLRNIVQQRDERMILEPFVDFLRNAHEPSSVEVLAMAAPYVHRSFEGEAIMTIGKAVDFVRKNLAGVVAVMPFTCMPGTISNAILKRVREVEDDFPFLNMVYDGNEQSTAATRLEAFMHQAREYMKRKGPVTAW